MNDIKYIIYFQLHMALWSTQSLTEMSTMNLSYGKGRQARAQG
jgi:hypothetical protein